MAIVARNNAPLAPFNFQPEGETVTFRLRGVNVGELMDIQAHSIFDRETKTVSWTRRAVQTALQYGLIGWDGFNDSNGAPVPFSKDAAENLERLGYVLAMQLFGKIFEASQINEEQGKNS